MRPLHEGTDEANTAALRLAEDLRQGVSRFVRGIRQASGTARSARSETLDLLERLGPVNVATLAEARGVTHQTMRLVVAQLEASGLTHQKADPSDRRSRLISLSSAGRDVLVQERETRTAHIAHAIQTKLTPGECDLLCRAIPILDRLTAHSS